MTARAPRKFSDFMCRVGITLTACPSASAGGELIDLRIQMNETMTFLTEKQEKEGRPFMRTNRPRSILLASSPFSQGSRSLSSNQDYDGKIEK